MDKYILVGTANVGKTAVYNALTHSNEKVSNFEGATVQKKETLIKGTNDFLVDIPGVDSLLSNSIVEKEVLNLICKGEYSGIINVIDINNFRRNAYLLIDILETKKECNIIFNMMDLFNGDIKLKELEEALNVNIVLSVKDKILLDPNKVITFKENNFKINYGDYFEKTIDSLSNLINNKNGVAPRFIAIQFLKGSQDLDSYFCDILHANLLRDDLKKYIIENELGKSISGYVFIKRRKLIIDLISKFDIKGQEIQEMKIMNKYFDKIALHKYFGYFVFIGILLLVFFLTFQSGFLSTPIEDLISLASYFTNDFLVYMNSPEWLISFIVDGAIAGVGGVLVFLPMIIVMFALLTFLEGIGYFSRVSALFEHLFEKIGLSSHSLIPYISGFGCNVFSVVSTRTIKSEPKRLATILSIPFISCSARLPVYLIFTEIFFDQYKAVILLFLYLLGIIIAIIVAFIIDKFIYNDRPSLTIHSLPSYKRVSMHYFVKVVYRKTLVYVKKAGIFILIGSMALWVISHISISGYTTEISDSILSNIAQSIAFIFTPIGFGSGEAIASLLSAFLAKELAISSMLIMYEAPGVSELGVIISTVYDQASALSFMTFTLLYIPCLSTLAVIKSETGRTKFVIYSILMSLTIGYIAAFIVYNVLSLFI